MKTAMQDVLGLVEQMFANAKTKEIESVMNDVINIITQQGLEKEKEQIIQFTKDWFEEYCEGLGDYKTPEQYYNQTYNN